MSLNPPAGPIALGIDLFRRLLAHGTQFQAFVDADDIDEALATIYEAEAPGDAAFPLAVVDCSAAEGLRWQRMGINSGPVYQGTIILRLLGAYDPDEDLAEQRRDFYNAVGAIINELMLNSGSLVTIPETTTRVIYLRSGSLTFGPILANDLGSETAGNETDPAGSYWLAELSFDWGLE
jgi:hypothetical protein